jgi:hypothetical protein
MRLFASLLRVHHLPDPAWWVFLVAIYVPATVLAAWPFAIVTGLIPAPRRGWPRRRRAPEPAVSAGIA